MHEDGMTLLESLVALAIDSVVLLGINSFYVVTLRSSAQDSAQIFVQRQGALVLQELERQIFPATVVTVGQCNADSNSVQAIHALGSFCFYRNGVQLAEDRASGTVDLLAGSPVPLTVSAFTSSPITDSGNTVVGATITIQLQDNAQNSMTFTTALARRN